jgi:hypothetical protein
MYVPHMKVFRYSSEANLLLRSLPPNQGSLEWLRLSECIKGWSQKKGTALNSSTTDQQTQTPLVATANRSTMKLSAALILAPFVLLTSAAPNPNTDGLVIKEKIAAVGAREVSPVDLHARAPVTGTVNTDGVRYRRCERTSCEAVGQYNNGQSITINCRVRGETVNGWPYVFQLHLLFLYLQKANDSSCSLAGGTG